MFKHLIVYTSQGQILRTVSGLYGNPAKLVLPGEQYMEVETEEDGIYAKLDRVRIDLATMRMVGIPEKPSEFHEWDWGALVYMVDTARLRAAKRTAIEAERDRRMTEPSIMYGAITLDANAPAKRRVFDKMTAVNVRGSPPKPGTLVWRDFHNVVHTFANMPAYKAWLVGFTELLDDRDSAAWTWSWQKKAQLDSITSVEDLLAFDPAE